ncbi:hypothetical protein BLNAU_2024 [Blattamonas nauphoetae]|uniref:Protein kinase domain-containing protein n=1 Tax=Blattamonas nauphoetae TaxID=2049346 RepID=A0ABQ9YGW9_9EUKA|nr:hypothetical protein BLNAU_2024 [Blattamonas nauphoetae]
MLTISSSRIEVSPWTSAIVISPSTLEESGKESSVVISKSLLWNDVGSMRGVVETSSFASLVGSVWVSIVGCSFDSSRIVGKDEIGLSLTRTPLQNVESVGRLSSSVIGCSFVNMSSIGSSRQPRVRHLDQKMLGCVVSLTSSHLSGSTIRDVNTGGSVLCSNSSFSFLLPSPNTDTDRNEEPSIIVDGFNQLEYKDGAEYVFDTTNQSTSVTFSHCHFTGDKDRSNPRPLTFDEFEGSLTLLSCSFENIFNTDSFSIGRLTDFGGSVHIFPPAYHDSGFVRIESCNFTECSAYGCGGAVSMYSKVTVTLTGCRCVGCSVTDSSGSSAGGMHIQLTGSPDSTVSDLCFEECTSTSDAGGLNLRLFVRSIFISSLSFNECSASSSDGWGFGGGMFLEHCMGYEVVTASHLKFNDCWTDETGGGLSVASYFGSISLTDCEFIHCKATEPSPGVSMGGGLYAEIWRSTFTMEGCHFVDCSSSVLAGAVHAWVAGFVMSDCLVKNCHSASTGAVLVSPIDDSPIALQNVLFVGNTVGDTPTYFDKYESMEDIIQFSDFLIEDEENNDPTDISITDCWTTTTSNSVGMYSKETDSQPFTRVYKEAFNKMGPYLTQKVEAILDAELRRIDLSVKGKIPLESQIYEVRLKEAEGSAEMTGELQFVNGVGSLLPSSNLNLKFSTAYTITSIVGVVPSSSESNALTITAEPWIFNLEKTPSFLSFTTPDPPPCLTGTTAYLLSKEPEYAYIVVVFNTPVSGSFDIVVEEEGKDVTITVEMNESAKTGESDKFVVVGDDRILTHDTTYTIKSIIQTPGTESTTTPVWMIDTITFHIPKSSFVQPGKDDKKTMSPETKKLLSWLLPLVGCLLISLVLAIIVIILLRRRKQKNGEPAQKEMEVQDQVEVDEKMEVVADDQTNSVLNTDGKSHTAFNSSNVHSTHLSPEVKSMSETTGELVEVMACTGGFEIGSAPMTNTLYSVLHKEHREIGKRGVGIQIVNGLKHVVAHRGWSDVLTRLSSHWILIDTSGNVQLKLQLSSTEAEQEAAQTKQQAGTEANSTIQNLPKDVEQSGMDGLRWRAPEVVAGGGSTVDGQKASVFSLGLVLWEIETGQVPFGELDAVNAQRQSATGVGPKMESLRNEEFIALILQCVSANPEQRPSLSEIAEFLSSHPEESHNHPHNEMKDQTQ